MIQPAPTGAFVRLETSGRKSGLPHIVELRFVTIGDSFYFLAGDARSDWVLNSTSSGSARVRSDAAVFEASAQLAEGGEKDAVVAEFARRYGKRLVAGWYRNPPACLRVTPTAPPRLRKAVTGEADVRTTYAEWEKKKDDYYADVENAFGLASEEYDFTISHNFINTWIRERSIGILEDYLRPDDVAVEIGCGTGAEAIEVSKHLAGLIATDISQKMVDLLKAKIGARGLSSKITPLRVAAADISEVSSTLGGKRVRVVYSFNGALNCEPRMERFVDELSSIMESGGYFVCSIRNTICLSEMISHALVLQFDKATPRKKQPAMVSVGGTDIPSTYYSARRFIDFFKPNFRAVRVVALPALLPPAYLNSYYLRARGGLPLLERLDILTSSRFPMNLLGDQTLFVFQKAGSA